MWSRYIDTRWLACFPRISVFLTSFFSIFYECFQEEEFDRCVIMWIADWGVRIQMVHQCPVSSFVLFARSTLLQVKAYQYMLVQFSRQAQSLGKVHFYVLTVAIRRMPWKENDQVVLKSLNSCIVAKLCLQFCYSNSF